MLRVIRRASPKLERGESSQRTSERHHPETEHHFRFRPALFLKMMMDRRHQENAPARSEAAFRVLEPANLDYDRQQFRHKHAADNHQRERLMNQKRHHANQSAERE